ncbi:MAG: glycosyltransferase N-terminal domain-containing protein, partial [Planctomycetota bacterium]|nr:glycosyltransferase N-terminal domain-containing protein [Planctomycetota bacterium]
MSLVLLMYNLIFLLGFLAYSPVLIWRKLGQRNYRFGLTERTGRVRRYAFDRPVIWVHGVSVGEIKAAGSMIDQLRAE